MIFYILTVFFFFFLIFPILLLLGVTTKKSVQALTDTQIHIFYGCSILTSLIASFILPLREETKFPAYKSRIHKAFFSIDSQHLIEAQQIVRLYSQ